VDGVRLLEQLRGLLERYFAASQPDGPAGAAGAADAGRPNRSDAAPPKLPFWTRRLLQQICRKQPQQLMAQKPWPTITAFYLQQRGIAKSLSRLLAGGLRSR
jgi:hypothetical protein